MVPSKVGVAAFSGPHCPYEGLKLAEEADTHEGGSGPHCPYEGLKRVDDVRHLEHPTVSSLPLRGIETGGSGAHGPQVNRPHCPYEGLKLGDGLG